MKLGTSGSFWHHWSLSPGTWRRSLLWWCSHLVQWPSTSFVPVRPHNWSFKPYWSPIYVMFVHLLVRLFVRSFVCSLICSLVSLFVCLLACSLTHSLVCSLVHGSSSQAFQLRTPSLRYVLKFILELQLIVPDARRAPGCFLLSCVFPWGFLWDTQIWTRCPFSLI